MFNDTIADMLTRLRNASKRGYKTVLIPVSKFKLEICRKLKEGNFLRQYYHDEKKRIIKADIKYYNKTSSLREIRKISAYLKASEIKKKCFGKHLYLISTPQGLLNNHEALQKNVGGKLICSVN